MKCVGDENTATIAETSGTVESPVTLSGYFWSTNEISTNAVRNRYFASSLSNIGVLSRVNSNVNALCIGD